MKVLKIIAKIVTIIMALFGTVVLVWNIVLLKTKGEKWIEAGEVEYDAMFGE